MQKKLLAVAVAGALIAPAAMAQTSVTISGALNLWYESAGAGGGANASTGVGVASGEVKRRDRIQDGAGSNIRFTVVEDLGGGMQAFGQVESAVFSNADTRNNAMGAGAVTGGWGNRNSGVGVRSSAWGEVLLGIWDIHYNEQYAADNQLIKGPSHGSVLGIFNSFGTQGIAGGAAGTALNPTIGARYSNVIRYQSPNWSGFNFKVAYARPTDAAPTNAPGAFNDNKKNKVWNFAPQYSSGPLFVGYSYLKDKDIANAAGGTLYAGAAVVTTGTATAFGTVAGLTDVTSHRFTVAYTLPMGFKLGFTYDRSKAKTKTALAANDGEVKRNAWAIPISWNSGAHTVFGTYGRAQDLKGNFGGNDLGTFTVTPAGGAGTNLSSNTGARYLSLGYQYDVSKRTTLHLNYSEIRNETLAGYDMFANPVGMTGTTVGTFGADPKIYSLGLRHAF